MRLFYFITFFQILTSSLSYSQHSFSIGTKIGFGLNVPSADATLTTKNNIYHLRSNGFYSGGVLAQYLLGDVFGIAAGFLTNRQTYSEKTIVKSSVKNYLGWNYSTEVHYIQIPIQLILKVNHPSNSNVNFKFTAGPSLEQIYIAFINRQPNGKILFGSGSNYTFITNLLLGIRIGNKRGKYGRIDYGIEYQYSLKGRYTMKDRESPIYFTARFSVLSFNLYYYFINGYLEI